MLLRLHFLFFGCLLWGAILAQTPPLQSITVSDGLSQGYITQLFQDRKGFLWIGTLDGLNRYDGYNIKRFKPQPFNQFSMTSSGEITEIYEDEEGLLWIGATDNLYLFDPATERFHDLSPLHFSEKGRGVLLIIRLSARQILVQFRNSQRLAVISTSESLAAQLRKNAPIDQLIQSQQVDMPAEASLSARVFERTNGAILLIDNDLKTSKAYRFDEAGYFFEPFDLNNIPKKQHFTDNILQGETSASLFRRIYPDGTDELLPNIEWADVHRLNDSVYLVKPRLDSQLYQIIGKGPLYSNFTSQGVRGPDFNTEFAPLLKLPAVISNWMVDRSNALWMGTGGIGLHKLNFRQLAFKHYLRGKSLYNLKALPDGKIWVGKHLPRLVLNLETGGLENAAWKDYFQRTEIYNLMSDHKGNLWFIQPGSWRVSTGSVVFWEKSANTYRVLYTGLPFLAYVAEQILEDKNGNIWVAGHNGHLLRFRSATAAPEYFDLSYLFDPGDKEVRSNVLVENGDGTLWLGTSGGLVKIEQADATQPSFTVFKHQPGNPRSLSINNILSIYIHPDQPHRLWIGTRGGGLNAMDAHTGLCEHFLEKDGLPNQVVYGLLPDRLGHIWGSTNRGIFKFNPTTRTFFNYQESDGLQSDEFNTGAYLALDNGQLLFGGVFGISAFDPMAVQQVNGPTATAITGIKVSGELLAPAQEGSPLQFAPQFDQTLRLPYDQNNITFEFAALDFTNPGTNRYRYKMIGLDKDWNYSGTQRVANYANLSPGSYTFLVQGAVADGQWPEQSASFHLIITPPWYKSWWALAVYILLIAAAIRAFIKNREALLLKRHKAELEQQEFARLKEMDTFKNRFLANITHEFRTPLTIIQGLAERIRAGVSDHSSRKQAKDILTQSGNLLELVNQLLDLAKLESNKLTLYPLQVDVRLFVQQTIDHFLPLADEKDIHLLSRLPQNALMMDFDPLRIRQIISNLLSNALRHTPRGGEVLVQLEEVQHTLVLEVLDNGSGINPADLPFIFDRFYQGEGQTSESTGGIGLALCKELVSLAGGQIQAENRPEGGAVFRVTLPIQRKAATLPMLPAGAPSPIPEDLSTNDADVLPQELPLLLLIEDNLDLSSFLQSSLQSEYKVIWEKDGDSGIQKALELIPDLILSDVMLPGKNGYEITRTLKNDPKTSHIPIVLLTAKADQEDRMEGYMQGANAYLTKPFREDELRWVLRNQKQLLDALKKQLSGTRPMNVPESDAVIRENFPLEDVFVKSIYAIFEKEYGNPDYSLTQLCKALGMSSSQLHRKLSALTDQPAMQMLRTFRLEKARTLLLTQTDLTVAQVSFMVGFNNPTHFSRMFSKAYGVPPSEIKN